MRLPYRSATRAAGDSMLYLSYLQRLSGGTPQSVWRHVQPGPRQMMPERGCFSTGISTASSAWGGRQPGPPPPSGGPILRPPRVRAAWRPDGGPTAATASAKGALWTPASAAGNRGRPGDAAVGVLCAAAGHISVHFTDFGREKICSRNLFEDEFLKAARGGLRDFGVQQEVPIDDFGAQHASASLHQ